MDCVRRVFEWCLEGVYKMPQGGGGCILHIILKNHNTVAVSGHQNHT